MPSFQTVAERCNAIFRSENADEVRHLRDLFEGERTLGDIACDMGLAEGDQIGYLDDMPIAMAAALKALIAENLKREKPYGLQVVPFVGPEWEFLITEVAPTAQPQSRGTISLMLRCPKL